MENQTYYVVGKQDGVVRRAEPIEWHRGTFGSFTPKWFVAENGRRYVHVRVYMSDTFAIPQTVRLGRLISGDVAEAA